MRTAYGFLWRDRRFGWFVLISLLPRLGFFMVPLGLLLYVRAQTGSVSAAGFALGAFGVASATQPVRGRLVDRYGRFVVTGFGVACAAALLLVLLVGRSRVALVGACAVVGVTVPPLGSYVRAVLSETLSGDAARLRSAYAADSAMAEGALVCGPLVVALLVALSGTTVTIVVAALVIELGCIALTFTALARDSSIGRRPAVAPAPNLQAADVNRSGVAVVLVATGCVTIALGAIDVAVPIFATRRASVADAGLLLGLLAAGTALGALWYGARPRSEALQRRLPVYTAPVVACLAATAVAGSPIVLGALLVLAGMAIGPLYVVLFALIERSVSEGQRTRAFAWEVTVTNTGAAVGSAGAGVLIAADGVQTAFAAAAAAAAVGLAVGLAFMRGEGDATTTPHAPPAPQAELGPPAVDLPASGVDARASNACT